MWLLIRLGCTSQTFDLLGLGVWCLALSLEVAQPHWGSDLRSLDRLTVRVQIQCQAPVLLLGNISIHQTGRVHIYVELASSERKHSWGFLHMYSRTGRLAKAFVYFSSLFSPAYQIIYLLFPGPVVINVPFMLQPGINDWLTDLMVVIVNHVPLPTRLQMKGLRPVTGIMCVWFSLLLLLLLSWKKELWQRIERDRLPLSVFFMLSFYTC